LSPPAPPARRFGRTKRFRRPNRRDPGPKRRIHDDLVDRTRITDVLAACSRSTPTTTPRQVGIPAKRPCSRPHEGDRTVNWHDHLPARDVSCAQSDVIRAENAGSMTIWSIERGSPSCAPVDAGPRPFPSPGRFASRRAPRFRPPEGDRPPPSARRFCCTKRFMRSKRRDPSRKRRIRDDLVDRNADHRCFRPGMMPSARGRRPARAPAACLPPPPSSGPTPAARGRPPRCSRRPPGAAPARGRRPTALRRPRRRGSRPPHHAQLRWACRGEALAHTTAR